MPRPAACALMLGSELWSASVGRKASPGAARRKCSAKKAACWPVPDATSRTSPDAGSLVFRTSRMGALFLSAAAAKSLSLSLEERCWSSEAAFRPKRLETSLPPLVGSFIASILARRESFAAGFALNRADEE